MTQRKARKPASDQSHNLATQARLHQPLVGELWELAPQCPGRCPQSELSPALTGLGAGTSQAQPGPWMSKSPAHERMDPELPWEEQRAEVTMGPVQVLITPLNCITRNSHQVRMALPFPQL